MSKMKRILASILIGLIATSMLSACTKDNDSSSSTDSSGSSEVQSSSKEEGSTSQEIRKISLLGEDIGAIWDKRETHESWKALQTMLKENNFELDFEVVASEQYTQTAQTRIAAGQNLPDLMSTSVFDTASIINMGKKGVLLDMKQLVTEKSNGNINEFAGKYFPDMWKYISTENDKAYWLPLQQYMSYKEQPFFSNLTALVRRDWLDKLNLEMPTTLDEYATVLKAFQDKDVNGNEKKDEKILYTPSFAYLAPSFGLPAGLVMVDPYDHKAKTPWLMKDELVEFVTYVKSLVDQNLIDTDALGQSGEVGIQKTQANQISSVFTYALSTWNDSYVTESGGVYEPTMLGKVKGEIPRTLSDADYVGFGKHSITKDCKDPQAVIDLLDMCYTEEYALLYFYGVEGTSHTVNDDGVKVLDPNFKNKEFSDKQGTGAQIWGGTGLVGNQLSLWESYILGLEIARPDLRTFSDKYCIGQEYWFGDYGLAVPTEDETAKLLKIQNDIATYSDETLSKLCLGQYDVSTIDKHIENLKAMGLEDMVAIYQARHDRFMATK